MGLPAKDVSTAKVGIGTTAMLRPHGDSDGLGDFAGNVGEFAGLFGGRMHGVEFSGRADLAVRLTRAATGAADGLVGLHEVDRGRIAYPMLPEPLTDVAFVGHAQTHDSPGG